MKNKELLKKNFYAYIKVINRADELREALSIPDEKYLFCSHLHNDNPSFTAWDRELGCNDFAEFEVSDGNVIVVTNGRYDDESVREIKTTIESWLEDNA